MSSGQAMEGEAGGFVQKLRQGDLGMRGKRWGESQALRKFFVQATESAWHLVFWRRGNETGRR